MLTCDSFLLTSSLIAVVSRNLQTFVSNYLHLDIGRISFDAISVAELCQNMDQYSDGISMDSLNTKKGQQHHHPVKSTILGCLMSKSPQNYMVQRSKGGKFRGHSLKWLTYILTNYRQ